MSRICDFCEEPEQDQFDRRLGEWLAYAKGLTPTMKSCDPARGEPKDPAFRWGDYEQT